MKMGQPLSTDQDTTAGDGRASWPLVVGFREPIPQTGPPQWGQDSEREGILRRPGWGKEWTSGCVLLKGQEEAGLWTRARAMAHSLPDTPSMGRWLKAKDKATVEGRGRLSTGLDTAPGGRGALSRTRRDRPADWGHCEAQLLILPFSA